MMPPASRPSAGDHTPAMKMPSYSSLLALAALIGLAACAPNTAWYKKGASSEEFRAAQRDCAGNADQYSFVDTSYYDGVERNRGSSATGDIYRQCMEGHGWHRQRTDQGPQ